MNYHFNENSNPEDVIGFFKNIGIDNIFGNGNTFCVNKSSSITSDNSPHDTMMEKHKLAGTAVFAAAAGAAGERTKRIEAMKKQKEDMEKEKNMLEQKLLIKATAIEAASKAREKTAEAAAAASKAAEEAAEAASKAATEGAEEAKKKAESAQATAAAAAQEAERALAAAKENEIRLNEEARKAQEEVETKTKELEEQKQKLAEEQRQLEAGKSDLEAKEQKLKVGESSLIRDIEEFNREKNEFDQKMDELTRNLAQAKGKEDDLIKQNKDVEKIITELKILMQINEKREKELDALIKKLEQEENSRGGSELNNIELEKATGEIQAVKKRKKRISTLMNSTAASKGWERDKVIHTAEHWRQSSPTAKTRGPGGRQTDSSPPGGVRSKTLNGGGTRKKRKKGAKRKTAKKKK